MNLAFENLCCSAGFFDKTWSAAQRGFVFFSCLFTFVSYGNMSSQSVTTTALNEQV
jgi:hypothetical protein